MVEKDRIISLMNREALFDYEDDSKTKIIIDHRAPKAYAHSIRLMNRVGFSW